MANSTMTAEDIGLTAAFVVMVTVNLLGNSLVCVMVCSNKKMKTPMNYLLVNLAIADVTVALFVSPQFIFGQMFVHPEGITGRWLCVFVTGRRFFWTGAVASALLLVSIALERYFAILHPLNLRRKITRKKVHIITICCWLSALLWLLPSTVFMTHDAQRNTCAYAFPTKYLADSFHIGSLVLVGAMPIGIMCYLYSRIIYILWIKRDTNLGSRQTTISSSRQERVTKICITITVFYALCWLPNLIQLTTGVGATGFKVTVLLVTLNSSVNPVLYTLQSEPFRKNLRKLFCSRNSTVVTVAFHRRSAQSGT